ncbi:hypothetical protein [Gloeothece verrucosa]|uniref:Uncharacterized protein n=1 Tax=Gloeothece verrucosa (strain PCC 7822) TaxID=497965 RepID=E0U8P9_GLOV7|nr:hypothetical protein [Gloeothece verrucosa]ADN14566.1 hypothetical protein Cyan7822_2595 [Gloeothece verrucosa PCC 7822]ADN14913.1 hypothetical protein Cyan7822_2956 [Gloeothece verrucosa PCC 7822]ADN15233.1 hypothetical protein Cyan7822_3283 [Gloeothece verrucosa PCC 7822]ADN16419.1 hypothetical protein Cyan7822_4509 [Gloeothece verrucosa PCC 7822]
MNFEYRGKPLGHWLLIRFEFWREYSEGCGVFAPHEITSLQRLQLFCLGASISEYFPFGDESLIDFPSDEARDFFCWLNGGWKNLESQGWSS